jgi:branched-chain amino acid transport system permease protein
VVANATGSLALGFAVALIVSAVVGVAIYRFAYQPLLGHPPFVPMIVSIGLFIVMQEGFRMVFGAYGLSFDNNPYYTSTISLGGIALNYVEIAMVIASVVLLVGFGLFAGLTRAGIGWRATVTDPQMATSFGVDPVRVRYLNFLFGSALAGIAGALVGLLNNYVEPTMGGLVSYKALAIIVLGGLGSVRGTLIASLILGVVESYGAVYLADIFDRDAIGFLFLIVVLMVRPQGLLGRK